jgi:Spy/CpxP family protein refolding chaperone
MRSKLPWILFALSLALNIFAVGGFIYAKTQREQGWERRSSMAAAAEDIKLNDAQKVALEKMRTDIRRSSEEVRNEMRPLRRELLEEVGKPQPDFAALDRRIDLLGDIQSKRYKATVRAVHEFQQTLTPEQREQFRKAMAEHSARRSMRRGRDGDDSGQSSRR